MTHETVNQELARLTRLKVLELMAALGRPVLCMSEWATTGLVSNETEAALAEQLLGVTTLMNETAKAGAQCALRHMTDMLQYNHPANFAVFGAIDTLQTLVLRDGLKYPTFVAYQEKVQQLEEELAKRTVLDLKERAVLDALLRERMQRDATPQMVIQPHLFMQVMSKTEWEADEKLKKAHAETEKALDELLLTRAEFGKEQLK